MNKALSICMNTYKISNYVIHINSFLSDLFSQICPKLLLCKFFQIPEKPGHIRSARASGPELARTRACDRKRLVPHKAHEILQKEQAGGRSTSYILVDGEAGECGE